MARKELFRDTQTFETTGTEEPEDDVFLKHVGINQTPDPGGRTTLEVTLGSSTGASSAWMHIQLEGEEEADFDGIDIDKGDTSTRSTIIRAPDADDFQVTVSGGVNR